jgi:hypothetical protein
VNKANGYTAISTLPLTTEEFLKQAKELEDIVGQSKPGIESVVYVFKPQDGISAKEYGSFAGDLCVSGVYDLSNLPKGALKGAANMVIKLMHPDQPFDFMVSFAYNQRGTELAFKGSNGDGAILNDITKYFDRVAAEKAAKDRHDTYNIGSSSQNDYAREQRIISPLIAMALLRS